MDEQPIASYMADMRRLLALFAFLSGLAAVGAPANAAVVTGVCEQVASSQSVQTGKPASCACQVRKSGKSGKVETAKGCKSRKPVIIYLPTVQFGADRAYE